MMNSPEMTTGDLALKWSIENGVKIEKLIPIIEKVNLEYHNSALAFSIVFGSLFLVFFLNGLYFLLRVLNRKSIREDEELLGIHMVIVVISFVASELFFLAFCLNLDAYFSPAYLCLEKLLK